MPVAGVLALGRFGLTTTARSAACSQALSRSVSEMGHVLRRHQMLSATGYHSAIGRNCATGAVVAVDSMTVQEHPIVLIYAARALRGFGDGFAIILLPVYLTLIGHGPAEIGLVATTALLGSAAT